VYNKIQFQQDLLVLIYQRIAYLARKESGYFGGRAGWEPGVRVAEGPLTGMVKTTWFEEPFVLRVPQVQERGLRTQEGAMSTVKILSQDVLAASISSFQARTRTAL
jgi:hypothetical protein